MSSVRISLALPLEATWQRLGSLLNRFTHPGNAPTKSKTRDMPLPNWKMLRPQFAPDHSLIVRRHAAEPTGRNSQNVKFAGLTVRAANASNCTAFSTGERHLVWLVARLLAYKLFQHIGRRCERNQALLAGINLQCQELRINPGLRQASACEP